MSISGHREGIQIECKGEGDEEGEEGERERERGVGEGERRAKKIGREIDSYKGHNN